jgi:hypothetical protein
MKKYKLLKDSTLMPQFRAGDTVYEFTGYDHGCVRDDMAYGGIESVAVVAHTDQEAPFFTVPVSDLEEI